MQIDRRTFFIISMVALAIAVVTNITRWLYPPADLGGIARYSLMAANFMALYYLYRFGRFRYSRFRFPFFLLLATGLIGILFQIQHWGGTWVLLVLPSVGIAVTYSLWFFTKPEKTLNDTLKVLCVNAWVLLPLLNVTDFGYFLMPYIAVLNATLLHTAYVHFKLVEEKTLEAEEPEWDFDKTEQQ